MTHPTPIRRSRIACLALAASVMVGAIGIGSATPASATPTPQQYFIIRAHLDFFDREPTADEITWWDAYLATHSRSGMITSMIESGEFTNYWVAGAHTRYVDGFETSDADFIDHLSDLSSTHNYLATELDVLESASYFSINGGTNTGYVTAIYWDTLNRAPDSGGLSYWVGRLNAATSTRRQVANSFIRSSEAAGKRVGGPSSASSCLTIDFDSLESIHAGSYCLILDRMADSGGLSYWTGQLTGSAQLPTLWASLAGSTEYYNLAQP